MILGAAKTGKSDLVSRYYANAFIELGALEGLSTETTRCLIDLDVYDEIEESRRRLYPRCYDTVGFATISGSFKRECVREAHVIVLMFDASKARTFEWMAANHVLDQLTQRWK